MSPVVIIAALVAEARSAGAAGPRPGLAPASVGATLVCLSGIGPARARAAALEAVRTRGAVALVSWGTAAALVPGLAAGQLLLPREVRGCRGDRHAIAADWHARVLACLQDLAPDSEGRLAHSDEVVTDVRAKARLAGASGAVAVDMETAAIADVAAESGLPLLVVRAVADEAGHRLPPVIASAVDAWGRAHPLRLAGGLARAPADIIALARLGLAFRRALRSLAAVRHRAGPDLAWGGKP